MCQTLHPRTHAHIHRCMHASIHACILACMHVYAKDTSTYLFIYTHMYIYIYMYTYIHTYIALCSQSWVNQKLYLHIEILQARRKRVHDALEKPCCHFGPFEATWLGRPSRRFCHRSLSALGPHGCLSMCLPPMSLNAQKFFPVCIAFGASAQNGCSFALCLPPASEPLKPVK